MRKIFLIVFLLQTALGFCVSFDEEGIRGTLGNGFTYFVRENNFQKQKASLRLVVKVGSIYENADEKGIAHFIEHMVFRGSAHFKDGEITRYLESIGSWFGIDSNASTSYESTVYELDIPLQKDALEKAIIILSDFASSALFLDELIDKERNVILEEFNLRTSSVEWRGYQKEVNTFLENSPYCDHFAIGKKNIIQNANSKLLRQFYKKWYRPDNMALIVVGDVDADQTETLIETHFGQMKNDEEKPNLSFKGDIEKSPQVLIHYDPEYTSTEVELISFFSTVADESITDDDMRARFLSRLITNMFRNRLDRLMLKKSAPVLTARVGHGPFSDCASYSSIRAVLFENRCVDGMQALQKEMQRALENGFTLSELNTAKEHEKVSCETRLSNLDKISNETYVDVYVDHYMTSEPLVSEQWRLQNRLELIDDITLEDINEHASHTFLSNSFNIFFSTASKELQQTISEELLLKLFEKKDLDPSDVQEEESAVFNVSPRFPKGKILNIKEDQDTGVFYWTLGNGINVLLKNTELENDVVHILAEAKGGLSSLAEENLTSAVLAADYCLLSGQNDMSYLDLSDFMETKGIEADIDLSLGTRSLHIKANPKNLEVAFQWMQELFAAEHFDQRVWQNLNEKYKEKLKQRSNDPGDLFNDFIWKINTSNHPFFQPLNIEKADEKIARQTFRAFFNSPQAFTFIIVGNFERDAVANLVETYLAAFPTIENPSQIPLMEQRLFPLRQVKEEFIKGNNPYATTVITIPCDIKQLYSQFKSVLGISPTLKILEQRLNQTLREELGGTYHIWVDFINPFFPDSFYSTIEIGFTGQPEKRKLMTDMVFHEINKLKFASPTQDEVQTIKALLLEANKERDLSNYRWIDAMVMSYYRGRPIKEILAYEQRIDGITSDSIYQFSQAFLSSPYYSVIYHLPEK